MRGIWPWEGGVPFWQNSLPMRLPAERPLSPHLSVYRPLYTMVLSILHRITGVALSAGSLLLVYWLWAVAAGEAFYTRALACLASFPGRALVLGLVFCFCYHFCNGIRHLAWDLGYGFEKRQARASGWMVVAAALVMTVVAGYALCRVLASTMIISGGGQV